MSSRSTFARPACRAAAFVLAVACAASQASAQTLGELAKQEEARRKAIASSGKVLTNKDVKSEPPPPGTAAPAAGAAPAGAPASSGPATPPSTSGVPPAAAGADKNKPAAEQTPAADPKKDEAVWRQRVQAARDGLARAQTFAEALQSRINALSNDFAARDDPAQRATISTDRQKAVAELDRVRQEIQKFTKDIASIQDEARKAGVPPGWVR